jgi:nucleotide-binding universal stress UspA family protein
MYKSIFVPLSSHGDQLPALAFGGALADAFDADAECAYASKALFPLEGQQKEEVGAIYRQKGYAASLALTETFYREQFANRSKQMQQWFEENKSKVAASDRLQWLESLEIFGETAEQIRHECSFHDLTVASHDLSTSILDEIIVGALFATGRPLALVRSYPVGKPLSDCTVLLAWKFTTQTLRAQWMAMPILKKAAKVLITSVDEGQDNSSAHDVEKMKAYLEKHGINAQFHSIGNVKRPAEALEQHYAEQQADLLVMGAYSHSRLREMVLGGFTRHFLQSGKCNLMLAH